MKAEKDQFTNNKNTMFSALASYINNALFTTLPETADLSTLIEKKDIKAGVLEDTMGLHIHEFIHQLHNLSTTAGLQLLQSRLTALQIFATGTDDNGHYIRQGSVYKNVNDDLLRNFEEDYFRIIGCTEKIREQGYLTEFHFEETLMHEKTNDYDEPFTIAGMKLKFKIAGSQKEVEIDNIGYSMITEGIAYEIEKQVRNNITGKTGAELEYYTPPMPYRLYRPIVEHLVGRECDLSELVKVGTIALQHKIPSHGLIVSTSALKRGSSYFEDFSKDMMLEFEAAVSEYQETIDQLERTVFSSTALKTGLSTLNTITTCAIQKRKADPFYELIFLSHKLTLENFTHIIMTGNFPPRCILQNKPDGTADYYWTGSNVSDLSDTEIGSISILQSALQFSQLHLSSSAGFNNTSELQNSQNNLSCPYIKICPLKNNRADPNLCSSSPWMHDVGTQEGEVCWYVNGVKSLRNHRFREYDDAYKNSTPS
ncbi:hypothetical protein [Pseudomonas parafulva]|uniref:hypothetical protein n=1 Tax=Pseudomonas parafulva TaxID=157782 RepID=UPI000428C76F|nr:hypothetical protein [Pseudomonas parafulva]